MAVSTSPANSELPEYARRLLGALAEPALFVTSRGEVLDANRGARRIDGMWSASGGALDLTARVRDPEKLRAALRTWARATEPTPGSFELLQGADSVTFNCRGSVIFPASETRPAILLVRLRLRSETNPFLLLNQKIAELNDEVERRIQAEDALRRSEMALRDRALEAETLNRTKDEFLATVSHELRTPLNAILGWSALLLQRATDPNARKGLEVIHRNALSQETLIEDILDVSRIITGKFLLETKPCDLVAIAEEAIEVVRPSAAAKEIHIVFVPPADPCPLVADPDRMRQVIWNLLSNAVKFTDRGGTVRLATERQGSQLTVTVSDTGRGIDPEFLPFVFDRFRQADSSTTRKVGGLGLGLPLVRHISELHGGSVQAFSDGLGKGATFTISLPIRAVATVSPPQASLAPPQQRGSPTPQDLEGLRVLVVDDEQDARELLALVLTQAGAVVRTAASVAGAFSVLSRFEPQVLVSDIGMPGEDGYSLIRRLREREPGRGGAIPALAITAYTRREDRMRALAAGFTTHIGKPVSPEALVAAVASVAASPR